MTAWLAFLASAQSEPVKVEFKPIATVRHPGASEMSGIVRSDRYPGVFWVHNDSGGKPRLFPIKLDGSIVKPPYEDSFWADDPVGGKAEWPGLEVAGSSNIDWEDITREGDTLYIADVGNNRNARRDLGVYVVPEPNPTATGIVRALKFLPVRYPDQAAFPPKEWFFDCEAIFAFRGKIHFITKHRKNGSIMIPDVGAKLYRLDSQHTDRPNVLRKLDEVANLGGWVTAADVSPNGQTLAVLTQSPVASIWFFDLRRSGDRMLTASSRRLIMTGAKQAEAIAFIDDRTVVVTNEQRDIAKFAVP